MKTQQRKEPRRHRRKPQVGLHILALLAVAVLVAACGGGSSHSPNNSSTSANNSSPGSNTGGNGSSSGGITVAFSQCMRTHGVPNFPDPNSNGVISGAISDGVTPSSPQFKKAQQECQKYTSGGSQTPQQQAQASARGLKYAKCMRDHGVPSFPDPNSNGAISGGGGGSSNSSVKPASPQFKSAQKICEPIYTGGKPVQSTSGG